jgi:hypothetical protein
MNAIGPVLLTALGASLGFATQTAESAGMGLRVPALFAALLMVAQGLLSLGRALRPDRADQSDDEDASAGEEIVPAARPGSPAAADNLRVMSVRASVAVAFMALAIWLGLAVLVEGVGHEGTLVALAAVSAFVLFALGWSALLGGE